MNRETKMGALRLAKIEPTVFFRRAGDGLEQRVDLSVLNEGPATVARLGFVAAGQERVLELGSCSPGATAHQIYIPDLRQPTQVEFRLLTDGEQHERQVLTWLPVRHWEVHLVQHSHHDLGYTDLPSRVLAEQDTFLDHVLDFCDETEEWPNDAKFRYVIEQAWSVLHYLEHRPQVQVERLVRLMREGRIEVEALMGNEISEMCGHEEQVRLAYPAFRLKQRFGVPIRTAELNDVPGLAWGLVSVLAGCGVRYISPGLPDYFAWRFKVHPYWDEDAIVRRDMSGAFWWEGPDGSKVLLWHGHGMYHFWDYEGAQGDLAERLVQLAEGGYAHDLVRMTFIGGWRDNSPPDKRLSLIARQWNEEWAYPRMIVSTDARFFDRFACAAGGLLPTFRGDLPNTDYTVCSTSTARETGVNRRTHDDLPSAEKFATCASLVSDYPYPAELLREAYDHALLHDEHCWGLAHPMGPGMDGCMSQKSEVAFRAAALTHDVLTLSTNRIADCLDLSQDGYHLVVFNPVARMRTDVVHAQAVLAAPCERTMQWRDPPPVKGRPPMWVSGTAIGRDLVSLPVALLDEPFELVDMSTGKSVPYQMVSLKDPLAPRPYASERWALVGLDPGHARELVFVAEEVPPLGYKTYRLVPVAARPTFASSLSVGQRSLESRFYRVTLDAESGAASSIFDKELNRELVDAQSPYGFNQLIVRSSQSGEVLPRGQSSISTGEAGPVFASLLTRGSAPGCPQRTQEIILYDSLKRVEFANRILKDATPLLEVYCAFPFAIEQPQFRYEASNAVIEPVRDQLPGTNTDAYASQHWVSAFGRNGGITWSSQDAPIVVLGDLWPGYVSQAHHSVTPPGYDHEFLSDPSQYTRGHIYSYLMLGNFRTNFPSVQVTDMLFRYAITSYGDAWDRVAASDFGWSALNPLQAVTVSGPQKGALPVAAEFCRVDAPNVVLLALKAAEDGDGVVARLWESGGRDTVVKLTLPWLEINQAFATNLVEEDQALLLAHRHTVEVPLRANGHATVRCRTNRRWPVAKTFAHY